MIRLLALIAPLALLTSQNALAQRYITWNELEFMVSEAPSANARLRLEADHLSVERPMVTTYRLRIPASRRSMNLTPAQFYLLAGLFAVRPKASSVEALEEYVRQQGESLTGVPAHVAAINALAREELGGELILQTADNDLKLADPPYLALRDADFSLHESNRGIVLHGYFLALTEMQVRLLAYISQRPNRTATYAEIAENFGWKSERNRARQYVQDLNRRTLRRFGMSLLTVQPGQGLHFHVEPSVRLPPPASHNTSLGLLQLTGLQEYVFQKLKLWELPLESDLFLRGEDYTHVALPLKDLVRGLRGINERFSELGDQRPLLRSLEIQIPYGSSEAMRWASGDFHELKMPLISQEEARAQNCGRYLTAPVQRGTAVPDWQLLNDN